MIEIKIVFSDEEVAKWMIANGLNVQERDIERYSGDESWMTRKLQVQNWKTGQWEDVDKMFHKLMEKRCADLFLCDVNKVDLLNMFK